MLQKLISHQKIIVIFAIFLLNKVFIYSQNSIGGKIIDSETGVPLSDVSIRNITDNNSTFSNNRGKFQLKTNGIYQFSKIGYLEKTTTIINSQNNIIQLEINPSNLNEVVVNAYHIPQKLKKSVVTVDIINTTDIERGNNTNLVDVLNKVPSVFMQTGALNTNKISIRGIGSRNLFGTSKIRAYFQDIPLTSGNGETAIEDFELGAISRIDIIKGAGSSIYGAGLGGTIHLIPKNAYLNETNVLGDVSFGSFGLFKNMININHGNTKNSVRAVYSNTQSNGYRENNQYNRQTFTMNSNHYIDLKNEVTFLLSYVDLKAFIPSSINENDYLNNPQMAAFNWAQAEGFEDSKRGVLGGTWNHQYNSNLKQITSVFTSFKDAYEPRPFDILTENTWAIGMRSRLLGTYKSLNWTAGGELFNDTYQARNFENLYQNFPTGTGSVEGAKFAHLKETRSYYNVFFEVNYDASEKTTLSIGLNYNSTNYRIFDQFLTDNKSDQSGTYRFEGMVSPKIGISHILNKNISLYSNISHGFSPPTTAETLLPDGLVNTNIKPEMGWNYEIGARAAFIKNRLQCNLALFKLDVKNLLVARRTAEDQFIGINAGKTQHNGLEAVVKYQWVENQTLSLNHYLSYTLNDFKFKEFIDNEANYSGNKLTGVPSNVLNSGIDFDTTLGVYASLNFQYVGKIPITDSNTLFSDSYSVTNIKLGYKQTIYKNLNLNAYFGLDNAFNEKYASQLLINAMGFGGAAPRYYYPGNPTNYYTGLNLNYNF